MSSHVENQVQARIEAARRREAEQKRQREELAAVRRAGLARRHAQKLRNLAATAIPGSQENPAASEEEPMPVKTPFVAVLLCPSCRVPRRCKPVGIATVGRRRREVLQCSEPSCELVWCPGREHLAATPTAA